MAKHDKPEKVMTSCPICGYNDEAGDPALLQDAINDHIRKAHNLDPATLNLHSEIKDAATVKDEFPEGEKRETVTVEEVDAYKLGIIGQDRLNQSS